MESTVTTGRQALFEMEADQFFCEYYDLTGKNFPPCNQKDWKSLDEWFADLRLAVYRERALKEVYGNNT